MKKSLGIGLALLLSLALVAPTAVLANPGMTVYDNDKAGWEAAVCQWATEDFEDKAVGPGVSVESTNGVIYEQASGNDLWWDSLTWDQGPTAWTTWTFDEPVHAFGGTWDLGSFRTDPTIGGPGSNIEVLVNGAWTQVGVIDNASIDIFWGFTSTESFTKVRLQAYNAEGWTERYTLDDMVYTDIIPPEVWSIETMNPHGKNIPPAGSTTLPGPKGGMNEDGFYELLAEDNRDPNPMIYVTDLGITTVFGPFPSGTVVKFTEAKGRVPAMKKIGSTNGKAGYVDWHIILPTDALVVAVDACGNWSLEIQYVPPPPK